MTTAHIEYAGGHTLEQASASRSYALAHAPKWVRDLAARGTSAPAKSTSTPKAAPAGDPCVGHIVGSVAPGVSHSCRSAHDQRDLPELFAPSAWASVLEQVRAGTKPIGLWERHNGRMLACTSAGTLRLEVHDVLGLMFEARIHGGAWERMLLRGIGHSGAGCSICYSHPRLEYQQRNGQTIRVITACRVDHIALVQPGKGERPVFPAARCVAIASDKADQLAKAWSDTRTASWSAMSARQAYGVARSWR